MSKEIYVFLDVDGVLNGSRTEERTPNGYTGIDDVFLEKLQKVVATLNAQIVLVSDWKDGWEKDPIECDLEAQYLNDRLLEYDLSIIDKTIDVSPELRGEGILSWLKAKASDDCDYLVFDDNLFDYRKHENIAKHVILTCGGLNLATPLESEYAPIVGTALSILGIEP